MLDLTEKCPRRLVPVIDAAIAYLTAHDEDDVIGTLSKYPGVDKKADALGRTLLHVAASQGKNDVIRWLVEQGANLLATDYESHWTALHRAAFYGYLDTVSLLVQLSVEECQRSARKVREFNSERFLATKDKDGLTYLDLLVADGRPLAGRSKGLNVTFTWGLNVNNNLGHERSQVVQTPHKVDCFRNSKINIAMVSIGTYHTIFLSHSGEVYTCGHGVGGRLGHGDEVSLLSPKRVTALSEEKCKWISASFNQSFFITQSGLIYGCGINNHNLLLSGNVDKLLTPKVLATKCLKISNIEKVFGHKNHVIIQTNTSIYTAGLNAGQLGHPKIDSERSIGQPRCVTRLNNVCSVATSDASTVVVTREGHVFLLQDYNCKKIFTSQYYCNPDCVHKSQNKSCVKSVCLSGGKLDEAATSELSLSDRVKPRSLIVVVLFQTGKMYLWTEATKALSQIIFSPRHVRVKDIALSRGSNLLALTSAEGQLWQGHVPYETQTSLSWPDTPSKTNDFTIVSDRPMRSQDVVDVTLTRVSNVHRAEKVTLDDKGTNFALIASNPMFRDWVDSKNDKSSIKNKPEVDVKPKLWFGFHRASTDTKMADVLRTACDIRANIEDMPDTILKSEEGDLFVCHRDVLTSKAPYFESMFRQYCFMMGWCESTSTTPISMNLRSPVLSIILTHIYDGRLDSCQQKDLSDYHIMCQCLLASDQYIMDDLKLSIEQHLCRLITLKNVTYLVSLSLALQAQFLESSTMEFICYNAPCLLESGAFNDVEPEILTRINVAYKNFINKQSHRIITPYAPLPFPIEVPNKHSIKKKRKSSKITLDPIKENDIKQPNPTPQLVNPTFEVPPILAVVVVAVEDVPAMPLMANSESLVGKSEVDGNKDFQKSSKGPIKKVSQKARKEEEKKKRLQEKEEQKVMPTVTIVNTIKSTPTNPWKIPSSNNNNNTANSPISSPTSPSFKALMQLDLLGQQLTPEKPEVKSPTWGTNSASHMKVTDKIANNCGGGGFSNERLEASFGLVVTNSKGRKPQKDQPSTIPPPSTPPSSPWGKIPVTPVDLRSSQRLEVRTSDVFDSIMKEEKDQLETRQRVTNKSLHLVQLEERAIEELKSYYGALEGGEHITITRAPLNVSKPLWAANQRSKKLPS